MAKSLVASRSLTLFSLLATGAAFASGVYAVSSGADWIRNDHSPAFAPEFTTLVRFSLWRVWQNVKGIYGDPNQNAYFSATINLDCTYTLQEGITGYYYYQYGFNCGLFNVLRYGAIVLSCLSGINM
eukprot:Sdes_comp14125_c0_seq1m3390